MQRIHMLKVYLTSAYSEHPWNYGPNWLINRSDSPGISVVDDPEVADIVLFVENHPPFDPYFSAVMKHPVFRKFRGKCVLYHDADRTVTRCRTISPSVTVRECGATTKASFHYMARLCDNHFVDTCESFERDRRYLFSFVGSSRTNRLRARILALNARREVYLKDTGQSRAWEMSPGEKYDYEKSYVETMLDSSYILCPRGIGPATYRQFEVMQLSRAPVIISDAWAPIPGIDWDRCAIRVEERDVEAIPRILEERSDDAKEMGVRARQAWEQYFAPAVALRRLVDAAQEVLATPYGARAWVADAVRVLHPWHIRNIGRHYKRRIFG